MPGVTIRPAGHGANFVHHNYPPSKDPLDLAQNACPKEYDLCSELLGSSFGSELESTTLSSSNGFVKSAIEAYNRHYHLRIRPDDVWFAILTQLSFYINAHAEELRGKFVAHEGKKELVVKYDGTRYTVDYGIFAKEMTQEIEKNIVDPELREWALPAFTTTTDNDLVVASVLLMGVVQKYFDYKLVLFCGLPSVTLLGEKADWELILKRLDKLETFGAEPSRFCALLKPVVSRFVQSFDDPTSEEVIDFWQRIAHLNSGGSGPSYYSGWITAFCFWDKDGKTLLRNLAAYPEEREDVRWKDASWKNSRYPELILDGAAYHQIDTSDVPVGFSSVPVKIDDNGLLLDALMIAGSVGISVSSSGKKLAAEGDKIGNDTVAPASGWWMFAKKSEEELAKSKHDREEIKTPPAEMERRRLPGEGRKRRRRA